MRRTLFMLAIAVAAVAALALAIGPCARGAGVAPPGDAVSEAPATGNRHARATQPESSIRRKPGRAVKPGRSADAAAAGAETADDDAAPAADPDHVRGIVLDDAREPVPGARVALHPCDPSGRYVAWAPLVDTSKILAACDTDAEGQFVLPAPAVAAVLVATKGDLVPGVQLASTDDEIEVILHRGAKRLFAVVDESGRPVADATLTLFADSDSPPRATTTTDADGRASLVAEMNAIVVVTAAGFATTTERAGVDAPDVATIVLHEGRAAAGVVVDSGGRPLSGAHVVLECHPAEEGGRVTTGEDGAFRFEGLDPRHTAGVVWALLEGWTCESVGILPGELDARIVLQRDATIRGLVVFEDGTPAAGARIVSYGRVMADELGRFEWTTARPGRCWVTATAGRRTDDAFVECGGTAIVDVAEGGVVDEVRVVVAPTRAIRSSILVRVVDAEDLPYDGAVVTAFDGDDAVGSSSSGGGGGFADVHVEVPPGTNVRLFARASARDADAAAPCAWSEDSAPTQPRGTPDPPVTVLRLGAPARVVLRAMDGEGRPVRLDRIHVGARNVAPPADGVLPIPTGGRTTLSPHARGFGDRRVDLEPPHPPLREVTVRFDAAARIAGRVLDEDGQPGPGLGIAVRVRSADGDCATSVATDDAGHFEVRDLPPGTARLRVRGGDDGWVLAVASVAVAAGASVDVGDLRLVATETVEGRIVDAAGRPVESARVEVYDGADDADTSGDGSKFGEPALSGADGSFRLRLPRSAELLFFITRTGLGTRSVRFDPAAPRPLRIALAPAGRVVVRAPKRLGSGYVWVETRLPGTSWAWDPSWDDDSRQECAPDDWFVRACDDLALGATEIVLCVGR